MTTALVRFDAARRALEVARTIDEVKDVRDRAEALRLYAKQAGESLEMQNACADIKLRAERRAGEMLAETEKNPGTRVFGPDIVSAPKDLPRLADLGISYKESSRWQLEARVPEEEFEGWVAQVKARKEELTSVGLRTLALRLTRPERWNAPAPLPPGKYRVIYADPPWAYENSGLGGSAEKHYPTLSVEEICALGVQELVESDAVLFLWVTAPFLEEGLDVCQAWGFDYKTHLVWLKDKPTYGKLGFYTYSQHELLFVATRGSCLPREGSLVPSVLLSPKQGHSHKPPMLYDIIEQMYPGPYVELYARAERPGWVSWGNEV